MEGIRVLIGQHAHLLPSSVIPKVVLPGEVGWARGSSPGGYRDPCEKQYNMKTAEAERAKMGVMWGRRPRWEL